MDDARFVSALSRGDPEGLAALVDALGPRLFRSACFLCGSESDAQDLVQETFLQALQSIHRFRGNSSLYTWLYAILFNLCRHHHRHGGRLLYDDDLLQTEPASETELPLSPADAEAAASSLREALGQLPVHLREVLVLRFYEDMKLDEIATQIGVPRGTVKSRLHYALKRMQQLLPAEMNLFGQTGTELTTQP